MGASAALICVPGKAFPRTFTGVHRRVTAPRRHRISGPSLSAERVFGGPLATQGRKGEALPPVAGPLGRQSPLCRDHDAAIESLFAAPM